MSEDIKVTDGTVLETLNGKVDLDGGNYIGSGLDKIIHEHCGGLEIGDIGIAPLGIDETKGKRRYLNGQLIIQEQYVQFTDKVKSAVALYPSLACTESEWQTTATMTVGGQVGKFVVDNDAGTIRLPKIIMPIQGLTDLSKLAEIVEAGLPNIEGTPNISIASAADKSSISPSGAFKKTTLSSANIGTGAGLDKFNLQFDASDSNPIYGNSNTVQPESIQYPYFIQVATGAETEDNIINEIELNNPFSLLDYKYSEYELNNISWLRSQGQFNSKEIYPAVYDLLLKIYNGTETKAGVSVKLSTETFTDYDFVLNTAEETFRLPIKVKLASGKAVVGNGMTLGITDGATSTGVNFVTGTNSPSRLIPSSALYGQTVGSITSTDSPAGISTYVGVGITTDPTKSGIETSDSDLYLYFYVGETVQNANLINAGRIEETLVKKVDIDSSWGFPSDRYINLTLGATGTTYTAPAKGWFVFAKIIGTANTYNSLQNLTSGVQTDCASSATGLWGRVYVPCKKGDEIKVEYKSTGETKIFRFIYAEGEV